MAWFSFLALVLWLPAVFFLFEKYPVQKAIVFSFITAWLFLPPTKIPLPGFPDWSKETATSVCVSLCCYLKYSGRLMAFRPKWFDLPVVVFCCCPFASSVTNGLGAYDGLSAMLEEIVRWGIPYLIGRVYLGDASGNRQLTLGMAVGGMIYVPFCLYELRMSPQLKMQVFGFAGARDVDVGFRYGGYRPMVFLSTGLELGWWMCCASLAAYMLWRSGSVKRLRGYPMAPLTAVLAFVTVACKSTGALLQITVGLLLIHLSKRTKQAWLVWALMAVGPVYCVVRPAGLWSGLSVVDFAASTFGAERAQSLGFRFEQEEILMRSANQRPIFGWGRFGGFNPPDAGGRTAITDGLWIIIYGWTGYTGLISLNLMLLVPTALFIKRNKPQTWFDVEVGPVTPLALILPLFMIDNLSNAMPNPIYALAMGSVSAFFPSRRAAGARPGGDGASLPARPARESLAPAGRRPLRPDQARDEAADDCEARAVEADGDDRIEDAADLFREAIQNRQQAIDLRPSGDRVARLAQSHALNARFLTRIGHLSEATDERERCASLWRSLAVGGGGAFDPIAHASNLNDLAWLLIADEAAAADRIEQAIPYAEEAVGIGPTNASFWNTLGIARYRHRDHHKAIYALSRSVSLGEGGGTAFDYYYLALANHALGYARPTADWFDRAEAWADRHREFGPALDRARAEATDVIQGSRTG